MYRWGRSSSPLPLLVYSFTALICTCVQEVALKNVLYLTTYCPALRDGVWELIFHQMLSIDVSTIYTL